MKYHNNVDYLIASIVYLGVHSYWWARSPHHMASELGLDENRLEHLFNAFPGIFRKSRRSAKNGQNYYALQARYAQKEGGDTADPEETSYIAPLDEARLQLLTRFVVTMAEQERNERRTWIANGIAVAAAIVSAATAVTVAFLKNPT